MTPWAPGGVVDDYRLLEELGSGAMGTVYVAEHTHTGARRALKALRPTSDPVLLLRFQREGEAQARVDAHPNVVKIHSLGQAGGRLYLVSDLVEGGDLAERLRRGPLPAREAASLVRDLANGLEHVHGQGVLHRDLKPSNVLFDGEGAPRLADFGLAHVAEAESLTETGTVLGTPAYMAPEQIGGRARDARVDVYGLGAVLYHCLTGAPPFEGSSMMTILGRVGTKPPRPPRELADVPAGLEAICLSALAKAPEDRPASARALAEALGEFLEGEADHPRSGRRLVWLAVGCVLAGGVLAAVALWPAGPHAREEGVSSSVERTPGDRAGSRRPAARKTERQGAPSPRWVREQLAVLRKPGESLPSHTLTRLLSALPAAVPAAKRKELASSLGWAARGAMRRGRDLLQAEQAARCSVALTPTREFLFHLARILAARGKHAEAITGYGRILTMKPEKFQIPSIHYRRAQSREQVNDLVGALQDYRRIQELRSSYEQDRVQLRIDRLEQRLGRAKTR